MSANPYLSKHLPGIAAGVVSMTSIKIIQTGLREVKSATANLKRDAVSANEESSVVVNWGAPLAPGEVRFRVQKGGTGHGNSGDTLLDVAFTAVGDR